jgi:multidrug efflux system membrane fusion protein
VPNPGNRLKGNTFATGRIIGRTVSDALLVPAAAMRQGGDGAPPFVYRVAGETVERAEVQVGVVDDVRGVVQILAGLAPGDRVIVGNVGAVGAGARVQVLGEQAGGGRRAEGGRAPGAPGGAPAPLPRPRS